MRLLPFAVGTKLGKKFACGSCPWIITTRTLDVFRCHCRCFIMEVCKVEMGTKWVGRTIKRIYGDGKKIFRCTSRSGNGYVRSDQYDLTRGIWPSTGIRRPPVHATASITCFHLDGEEVCERTTTSTHPVQSLITLLE